jgi:hypothetical protein
MAMSMANAANRFPARAVAGDCRRLRPTTKRMEEKRYDSSTQRERSMN